MLHTWSLAIEEQFYITFPLFLLAAKKYYHTHLATILIAGLLLSFALSIFLVGSEPERAFYLPHTRAWELLLGCLLAIGICPRIKNPLLANVLAVTGVGLITVGVHFYSTATPFPGLAVLPPCLGTFLFIWANGESKTPLGKFLSLGPVVFVGLISYSLYLWHWPLIVFAKYYLVRPLTGWEVFGVLSLSVMLAVLAWRFVEQPFRGRRSLFSRNKVVRGAITAAFSLLVLGCIGHASDGFSSRQQYSLLDDFVQPHTKACLWRNGLERLKDGKLCKFGTPAGSAPDFIVWGDSYADALSPLFQKLARETSHSGVFIGEVGCVPLVGVKRHDYRVACEEFADAVVHYIIQEGIPNVFLAGRWELALGLYSYELADGNAQVFLSDDQSRGHSLDENFSTSSRGMLRTLKQLVGSGKNVWVVLSPPETGVRVPQFLARRSLADRASDIRLKLDEGMDRHERVSENFAELGKRFGARFLDPASVFCVDHDCLVSRDGHNLYRDDNHLLNHGAYALEEMMRPVFDQL